MLLSLMGCRVRRSLESSSETEATEQEVTKHVLRALEWRTSIHRGGEWVCTQERADGSSESEAVNRILAP